ncbi:MAG: histidine phosphatase family protein [Burkholderiaceae bacterium]|nr:histidine phosphatase family protein [Burkholderiaceae bacterium]
MSLVFLVRHAQASFGAQDYDRLSELGRQQARWLGGYFAERGLRFSRALAGTLSRQQDTAREVLAAMGSDPGGLVTHAGLDEYHGEALYSAWSGGADPRAQQRADYREYWRAFRAAMQAWSDDRLVGVPESWAEFGARVRAGLEEAVRDTAREDVVLVVSSGGAIGRALADIAGAPARTAIEWNLQLRNSGFCELIAGGGTLRLLSFNSVPHLETPARRQSITFA